MIPLQRDSGGSHDATAVNHGSVSSTKFLELKFYTICKFSTKIVSNSFRHWEDCMLSALLHGKKKLMYLVLSHESGTILLAGNMTI